MASSAFKSSSRKPNSKSKAVVEPRKQQNQTHKLGPTPTPRRSSSVTAFDSSNTRDNPLFWGVPDSPSNHIDGLSDGETSTTRGRSILRNSLSGRRSLSTVDTRRQTCRFLSPDPRCPNVESVGEQQRGLPSNFRSNSNIGLNCNHSVLDVKNKPTGTASDVSKIPKGCNTWSSQHPSFESSDGSVHGFQTPHCNDGMSSRAILEVEERTILPVSEEKKVIHWEDNNIGGRILETVRTEVKRAISDMHKDLKDGQVMLRSDSEVSSCSMFPDDATELPNPMAVDLARDFREEFLRELEEHEKHTRELRAELAAEEHRELELNQILNDMIPEPETPHVQNPRLVKNASIERKKMSKHLEEEAMAYFDECVSISTFDDSDFSLLEDPPSHKANVGETTGVLGVTNTDSVDFSLDRQDLRWKSPRLHYDEESYIPTSGITSISLNNVDRRPQFSFTSRQSDSTSQEQGIKSYIKMFSKEKEQGSSKSHAVISFLRKSESYDSNTPVEKVLLDRMAFRNRIDSGGMLICGGGIGFARASLSSNLW